MRLLLALSLVFLSCQLTTAQFVNSQVLKLSIDRFETTLLGDVKASITISGESCTVEPIGFTNLHPYFTIVSANDELTVLHDEEGAFISVDHRSCVGGKFVHRMAIELPAELLLNHSDLVLKLSLRHKDKREWRAATKVIPLTAINQQVDKKIKPRHLVVENVKAQADQKGISLHFGVKNTMFHSVSMRAAFFLGDETCGATETLFLEDGKEAKVTLSIYYNSLFLPPGKNVLRYKILASTVGEANREMHTGLITIQQPQFYKLSFESTQAAIDVAGMDKVSGLAQMFSKNGGKGLGDAYYEIRNDQITVFRSPHVNHSGRINDQQGTIQIDPSRQTKIYFLDKDVLAYDLIEEYTLSLSREESNTLIIRHGRILNFNFSYRLERVTTENYRRR